MRFRTIVAVILVSVAGSRAVACSICGESFARRLPLRMQYADAPVVLFGQLKNPRPAADGIGGTTEFHIADVLKTDAKTAPAGVLTVPRYLPVIANTPPDYLFFCSLIDGRMDFSSGQPANAATIAYLKAAVALDAKAASNTLHYYFRHLDSKDESISADAFLEFARAADADLAAAAGGFDRIRLRTWIADPTIADNRVGIYALLLGLTGKPEDATFLAGLLSVNPRPERYTAALGGMLAGLILLDADHGWTTTRKTLTDAKRPFTDKLNAFGTLRYFHATRPKESRAKLIELYRAIIDAGEIADLAIDDLRRWGWWDLSEIILAKYGTLTHAAVIVRRGIVRYALTCPHEETKSFVAKLKRTEPELVATVEEGLKAYELTPPKK